jgi:hypothetical protein
LELGFERASRGLGRRQEVRVIEAGVKLAFKIFLSGRNCREGGSEWFV